MPEASILVVDDLPAWRARVQSILRARPEWEPIYEACDGLQAVEMANELSPDIVLLDIGMPRLNGIEAARQIRLAGLRSKIIFLTQENDADIRETALSTGAEAYLLKVNVGRQLLPAIEAALRNGHLEPAH